MPGYRRITGKQGGNLMKKLSFEASIQELEEIVAKLENGQNYSQNCLCNINKFLSVYNLVKVAAWQSSNIGCFFVAYF